MKNYLVSVMEAHRGLVGNRVYTGKWIELGKIRTTSSRRALREVAPITEKMDEEEKPEVRRSFLGVVTYEYNDCRYCVEII